MARSNSYLRPPNFGLIDRRQIPSSGAALTEASQLAVS